ncbi:MAG: hypothetical protein GX275_11250 [Clostridiales bacterium]|nr:hypothetical protein [Clostridiales bacterium]
MSIYNLSPEQLLTLSYLTALNSARGLTIEEQEVLGYFFVSIGENILLFRSQNVLLKTETEKIMKKD